MSATTQSFIATGDCLASPFQTCGRMQALKRGRTKRFARSCALCQAAAFIVRVYALMKCERRFCKRYRSDLLGSNPAGWAISLAEINCAC